MGLEGQGFKGVGGMHSEVNRFDCILYIHNKALTLMLVLNLYNIKIYNIKHYYL